MNSSRCLFLGFILIVVSCGQADSDANSYSGKVKEELRSREVVHLTPGQISERAFALGDSLIAKAAATFAADIQKSGDSVCTLVFQKTARVIKSKYDATIMRIPFDATRLATISSKREKEILDAYFYNRENKLPLEPNLQGDGQKEFLFTKPLTISDKSCLRCHEQHPNPSLKGILGDTIGIWDLRLTKKQVVLSFVD